MTRKQALILILAVLMTAAVVLGLRPHLINHDVAQFMYGARVMLAGGTLYRDFIEMNLPTAYWLSALPVLLASLTGIDPGAALMLCMMAGVALSLALCALVLNRSAVARREELLLLVLAAELLPAFHHFGQREHLFVILVLPYVLSVLMEGRALALALAVAVPAGFGLALKPYFLVLPLFAEAAAPRRRWGHVQSWVGLAVAGAVLGASLWRHPEYVRDLLPLARATYGGWEAPLALFLSIDGFSSSALALWLAARLSPAAGRHPAIAPVAALLAAGLAIAAMQNKGYDYHMLPAVAGAVLLLALVLTDWVAAPPGARRPGTVPGVLLALFLLGWDGARFLRDALHPFDYVATGEKMAPVVERWGGAQPMAGLSVHVFPTFPYLLRHGGEWALRYPSLWPLVGYFKAGAATPPGPELQALRRIVAEDLETRRPCVVFVDTWGWWGARFPLVEFLSAEPRFAASWENYRLVDSIDGYDIYSRCALDRHSP